MKELVQIWNRVTGRRYSAVNTSCELKDFTSNRVSQSDIDSSIYEANIAECEVLNRKFDDDLEFNERRDAIINRLFDRRRKGRVARQPRCLFLMLMLGFIALASGFFILFLHPYDFIFNWKSIMSDGGEIFEMWRKPSVPLYANIYLFNITNAEEFMAGIDKKIKLVEVGPYVYKEELEHTKVKFNDNGTFTTVPVHPLTWVEEMSKGNKEDDLLYLPHIALLSIANVVAKQSFITRFGLNNLITLTKSKPLVKMTAKEFMMGYQSQLLTLGNNFLPGWIYFEKLGLIDRMYDFEGDFETIFTGETDVTTSGLIDTYKGSTDLPQWDGKHCSNVQYASDGTRFKSKAGANESLLFYRKSLCRAGHLVPVKEGVHSGLKAYMYTFEDNLLDNGKYNENNKCYCRKGKCLPVGLIDVTDCYYGFPIALSYPHFYKGDDILSSKVEGMKPNKDAHETRFWIQPESGLPLSVSSKFQINMALEDLSMITNTEKFSNMYLPMLWFDIRMYQLPKPLEYKFKMYINVLPQVEKAAMYIFFTIGITLIILTVYRLTFQVMFKSFDRNGKKKHKNIIIGTDLWVDHEKIPKLDHRDIYTPCEIPLGGPSDGSANAEKQRFLKTHSDKIKELSLRLGDKVYDSVGSVKGKVCDELTHVRSIFKDSERKNSLIVPSDDANVNEAYKSDTSEDSSDKITSDPEDECQYLEVIDDGREFDVPVRRNSVNIEAINRMNELESK